MFLNALKFLLVIAVFSTLLISCSPSPGQLKKVLTENPDIIMEVIEKNPLKFAQTFQKAHRDAQIAGREQAEKEEKTRREEEFKSPKKPVVQEGRATLGDAKAPILIVEYSDFQCPYCKKGASNMGELRKKYGNKIRYMFKHLPLDFHPVAMPAAQRFEAIALQDKTKAYQFHDKVFESQDKLRGPDAEKTLDAIAKEVGANVAQMKKDMAGAKVAERIKADMDEARNFGFSGTPGYVIAGVTLRGAYPVEDFSEIIDRKLKEQGL